MPHKKRDKELPCVKNPKLDNTQADHELFLQAFEKPTQIYRYLRNRHAEKPLFLNRTLSYMKQRMSRSNAGRKNFRVDSLLKIVEARNKVQASPPVMSPGFMVLTFLGFSNANGIFSEEPVEIETLLLKICHKKRKEVSCPVNTDPLGTCSVPLNISSFRPSKAATVSIPTEAFTLSNGHVVKSYHVLIRIATTLSDTNNVDHGEPAEKKIKLSKAENIENGVVNRDNKENDEGNNARCYSWGGDLTVYDKQSRCLLEDGEYELPLEPLDDPHKPNLQPTSWEYIDPPLQLELDKVMEISGHPKLKFRLEWVLDKNKDGTADFKENNDLDKPSDEQISLDNNSNKENNKPEKCVVRHRKSEDTKIVPQSTLETVQPKRLQIVYQFLYNNNSRQQTEASEDLHCPWCSVHCRVLYALLKHLKLSHSRFTFTYVPTPTGARIDVAINDQYDGSFSGSPAILGYAFSRSGPIRRTSCTSLMVCHPKRPRRPSLSEFNNELDENEYDGQRSFMTGHSRCYHHTITCQKVQPKDLDVDSEDETDPKWLQKKTMMMIDEFTDVNEGEKELMKMWNLHIMKHGFVGDCQIPLACSLFLEARGKELLAKNLYRNFVLHMCSLFDFGLISPVTVYTIIQKLQQMVKNDDEASRTLFNSCRAQQKYWLEEGMNKPSTSLEPRRILQSPQSQELGIREGRRIGPKISK